MNMDSRIRYELISDSYGCDNCEHEDDGRWLDFCASCNPDYQPPSNYRPARNTIQEKLYYGKGASIKFYEYLRFLGTGK